MSNANPSRLGQVNSSGDVLALMLKVFAGEVLTAFQRAALYRGLHTMRTIPNGKSAQFPAMGQFNNAYYHTPGEEILGEKINANEVLISIEGQLVAPAFIANIDEAMNHYDVRSIYSTEIGQALAKFFDQNVHRTFIKAARATTPTVNGVISGDVLDSTLTTANYATDGATLIAGLIDAGVLLDTRDVPRDRRFVTVDPARYALLVKSEKLASYDLNAGMSGNYGYVSGVVPGVDGSPIFKTNNYVKSDDRLSTILPSGRNLDFSTSQALLAHPSAAGTVALQDVTMESEYDIRRQGTLMLGKYICGHDKLRAEAAVELQSSAPAA